MIEPNPRPPVLKGLAVLTTDIILLYYDMKCANGVSEAEIKRKREKIAEILVTYPSTWYIDTLNSLGSVDIINANTTFFTFRAVNPA